MTNSYITAYRIVTPEEEQFVNRASLRHVLSVVFTDIVVISALSLYIYLLLTAFESFSLIGAVGVNMAALFLSIPFLRFALGSTIKVIANRKRIDHKVFTIKGRYTFRPIVNSKYIGDYMTTIPGSVKGRIRSGTDVEAEVTSYPGGLLILSLKEYVRDKRVLKRVQKAPVKRQR